MKKLWVTQLEDVRNAETFLVISTWWESVRLGCFLKSWCVSASQMEVLWIEYRTWASNMPLSQRRLMVFWTVLGKVLAVEREMILPLREVSAEWDYSWNAGHMLWGSLIQGWPGITGQTSMKGHEEDDRLLSSEEWLRKLRNYSESSSEEWLRELRLFIL